MDDQKISKLSQDRQWIGLLHLFSSETPVISEGFYLSKAPKSKVDPRKELQANLQVALSDPTFRCRFPARLQWLQKNFAELKFAARVPCPELDEWRGSQDVESLTIVYPDRNTQTSLGVFSHTFLKFNLARWSKRSNLNVALGFAAELHPQESFFRMVSLGLSGGYIAKFSFSTYDAEVRRYGESESRDIFEYDLKFTNEEIQFLLDHLWELQGAEFHYYFLNGNCSYHLLTLLEVARPSLDLSSHFHFFTVPSTSLRLVLAQKDLVSEKRWIPGKHTRENQKKAKLSLQGKVFFRQWRNKTSGDHLAEELRNASLSTPDEMLLLDLLAESSRGNLSATSLRTEALNLRSQLPPENASEDLYPRDNPEVAHGGEMLSAAAGTEAGSTETWLQLRYRPALHNALDPSPGYFKNSTFELADLRLRFSSNRQFENSSVTLINAMILTPDSDDEFHFSWQARSKVLDFLKSPQWQNIGGIGWAQDFGAVTFSLMAIADSYLDRNEKRGFGTFAGVSGGLMVGVFEVFRLKGSLDYLWPIQSNHEGGFLQSEVQISYTASSNWSLQLGSNQSWRERSAIAEVLFYF